MSPLQVIVAGSPSSGLQARQAREPREGPWGSLEARPMWAAPEQGGDGGYYRVPSHASVCPSHPGPVSAHARACKWVKVGRGIVRGSSEISARVLCISIWAAGFRAHDRCQGGIVSHPPWRDNRGGQAVWPVTLPRLRP